MKVHSGQYEAVARGPRCLIGMRVSKLEPGRRPERPLPHRRVDYWSIAESVTLCYAVISAPAAREWGITRRVSLDAP
jgi:hypothetical protein